jgi:hypothetical protein
VDADFDPTHPKMLEEKLVNLFVLLLNFRREDFLQPFNDNPNNLIIDLTF